MSLVFFAYTLSSLCRLLCFLFSSVRCWRSPEFLHWNLFSSHSTCFPRVVPPTNTWPSQPPIAPSPFWAAIHHWVPRRSLKLSKYNVTLITFLQSLSCFTAESVAPHRDLVAIWSLHFVFPPLVWSSFWASCRGSRDKPELGHLTGMTHCDVLYLTLQDQFRSPLMWH